jgi:hypothetical protein
MDNVRRLRILERVGEITHDALNLQIQIILQLNVPSLIHAADTLKHTANVFEVLLAKLCNRVVNAIENERLTKTNVV